jgi:Fe-S cluster biogenesis protein NfuA
VPIDETEPDTDKLAGALGQIRAALALDGGGVKLVSAEGRLLRLRMLGACRHCPSKLMTQRYGIEAVLRNRVGKDIVVSWVD